MGVPRSWRECCPPLPAPSGPNPAVDAFGVQTGLAAALRPVVVARLRAAKLPVPDADLQELPQSCSGNTLTLVASMRKIDVIYLIVNWGSVGDVTSGGHDRRRTYLSRHLVTSSSLSERTSHGAPPGHRRTR